MSYSLADEYDRRIRARRIEYERRCDAVVYDPNNPQTMFPEAIVNLEMESEAAVAAAARMKAYEERAAASAAAPKWWLEGTEAELDAGVVDDEDLT